MVSGLWQRKLGIRRDGLMAVRRASINDLRIAEDERLFHWPLGPRPKRTRASPRSASETSHPAHGPRARPEWARPMTTHRPRWS